MSRHRFNARLPVRSLPEVKLLARALFETYPAPEGTSRTRTVSDFRNALARCLGFRSFCELRPPSNSDMCRVIAMHTGELRFWQRIREVCVLSTILKEIPRKTICSIAEDLDLVDWDAVAAMTQGDGRVHIKFPLTRAVMPDHQVLGWLASVGPEPTEGGEALQSVQS